MCLPRFRRSRSSDGPRTVTPSHENRRGYDDGSGDHEDVEDSHDPGRRPAVPRHEAPDQANDAGPMIPLLGPRLQTEKFSGVGHGQRGRRTSTADLRLGSHIPPRIR